MRVSVQPKTSFMHERYIIHRFFFYPLPAPAPLVETVVCRRHYYDREHCKEDNKGGELVTHPPQCLCYSLVVVYVYHAVFLNRPMIGREEKSENKKSELVALVRIQ